MFSECGPVPATVLSYPSYPSLPLQLQRLAPPPPPFYPWAPAPNGWMFYPPPPPPPTMPAPYAPHPVMSRPDSLVHLSELCSTPPVHNTPTLSCKREPVEYIVLDEDEPSIKLEPGSSPPLQSSDAISVPRQDAMNTTTSVTEPLVTVTDQANLSLPEEAVMVQIPETPADHAASTSSHVSLNLEPSSPVKADQPVAQITLFKVNGGHLTSESCDGGKSKARSVKTMDEYGRYNVQHSEHYDVRLGSFKPVIQAAGASDWPDHEERKSGEVRVTIDVQINHEDSSFLPENTPVEASTNDTVEDKSAKPSFDLRSVYRPHLRGYEHLFQIAVSGLVGWSAKDMTSNVMEKKGANLQRRQAQYYHVRTEQPAQTISLAAGQVSLVRLPDGLFQFRCSHLDQHNQPENTELDYLPLTSLFDMNGWFHLTNYKSNHIPLTMTISVNGVLAGEDGATWDAVWSVPFLVQKYRKDPRKFTQKKRNSRLSRTQKRRKSEMGEEQPSEKRLRTESNTAAASPAA